MATLVPDRMTVFQRCVSEFSRGGTSAQEARDLLTKLVHLFFIGESFSEAEATQLFFTITRLFQKESAGLKQMIYLAIKQLAPLTENVIMSTSVLIRDIQEAQNAPGAAAAAAAAAGAPASMDPDFYLSQALRALCTIVDATAVPSLDRIVRPALVSKAKGLSAAALVSAYRLFDIAPEQIKRYAIEAREIIQNGGSFEQFLALGFLAEVRKSDSMSLRKLVAGLASDSEFRDSHFKVLHAKLAGRLLLKHSDDQLLRVLEGYLNPRHGAATLEAAKAVLAAEHNVPKQVQSRALMVLAQLLQSPAAPSRFAAVRVLTKFAEKHADEVGMVCNDQLEALVSDPNKGVASYAMAALLKTGSEQSVDGLIKRISNMLNDFSNDFKLVAVDAVVSFAKRFPRKRDAMLGFLVLMLEHQGSAEVKISVVEAIGGLLRKESEDQSGAEDVAVANALLQLCETIEDSEYVQVTVCVLHLLGEVGPRAPQPATYVRFIQNRVILENAVVRAAAVSALAKFESVVPGAASLVKRAANDPNDEVRDRAAVAKVEPVAKLPSRKLDVGVLQAKLEEYLKGPTTTAFSVEGVPLVSDAHRAHQSLPQSTTELTNVESSEDEEELEESSMKSALAEVDFSSYGQLLNSAPVYNVTDDEQGGEELEYRVKAQAHLFSSALVLQFEINNNFQTVLTNLRVATTPLADFEEQPLELLAEFPIPELRPSETKSYFAVFKRDGFAVGAFATEMQFLDESGAGDEYPLADFPLFPAVYLKPVEISDYEVRFEEFEIEETSTAAIDAANNVSEAASLLAQRGGLARLSPLPEPDAQKAQVFYAGSADSKTVVCKAQIVHSTRKGVVAKFIVRGDDDELVAAVASGVQL